MDNQVVNILVTDLSVLIRDLTKDGGLMGPSIYDTAQVIRMAPPASGVWPALNWLMDQRHNDGGWGDPAVPLARDVPTLAVLLALHTHASRDRDRAVVQSGLAFLRRHAIHWAAALPDALPVGVELVLPHLLQEARRVGLKVPEEPYARLFELHEHRQRLLARFPKQAGTTPVHTWEAWGTEPDPNLIDATGGVGHSPAATAAWLRAAANRPDLAEERAAAQHFLEQAAAVTGIGIPGVVPTAWPITRFEQSFALYALFIGGLLEHPALRDVLQPQLDDMAQALRPTGIGFSDCFSADGDDTAAAIAVLEAAGYHVDMAILEHFAHDEHFCAYAGELQPSLSVTAHAAHALTLRDETSTRSHTYMINRQLSDGRWCDDKWNGSWLYTTSQVMIALLGTPSQEHPAIQRAIDALLAHQHSDGGWSAFGASTTEETAYGILALRAVVCHGLEDHQTSAALERAERWMLDNYRPFHRGRHPAWIAKENYRPQRIVRMLELVATFPSTELAVPLRMAQSIGGSQVTHYAKHSS